MKTYLAADPGKVLPENMIVGEIHTAPALNTPLPLGHDIFFGDSLTVYTNPADPVGSVLQKDSDYLLDAQDSIATDQSGSACYTRLIFLTPHPFVYLSYHAYGDYVTNEFVTEISSLTETLEPRVTVLEASDETQNGQLYLHGQQLTALESLTGRHGSQLTTHTDRLMALETNMDEVIPAVGTLESTLDPIPGQIETLEATTSDHGTRLSSVESEIVTQSETLAAHETRISNIEDAIETEIDAVHLAFLMKSLETLGTDVGEIPNDLDVHQLSAWVKKMALLAFPPGVMMSFDANNPGPTVTAGNFVVGRQYKILTIGTTNFVAIGAATNTVGLTFTATAFGGGTGTASDLLYSTGAWVDNVTIPGWYACVAGNARFGCPDLSANAYLAGKPVAGAGSFVGTNSYALTVAQLPAHAHPGSTVVAASAGVSTLGEAQDHVHAPNQFGDIAWSRFGSGNLDVVKDGGYQVRSSSSTGGRSSTHTHAISDPTHTHTIAVAAQGSGSVIDNRPWTYLVVPIRKCA